MKQTPTDVTSTVKTTPLTVTHYARTVALYSIFEMELDVLASSFSSLSLAFTGFAFGLAATCGVTVITIDNLNPKTNGILSATAIAAALLTLFFGYNATRDWRKSKDAARAVRQRPLQ